MVPLLCSGRKIDIRHIRMPSGRSGDPGTYRLARTLDRDNLLSPEQYRPAVRLVKSGDRLRKSETKVGNYTLSESLDGWLRDIPENAVILLHIDCDYFNNRYDGDSDWREHSHAHDPSASRVKQSVEEMCSAVTSIVDRLDDVTIALSPSFFPAEYWGATVESLISTVAAGRRPSQDNVNLRRGKGSPDRGGGPGGRYWHVFSGEGRVGSAWINRSSDEQLGACAILTLELNQASRGRGIGRVAYRLAAEASGHAEVWLHMRNSNLASRKAAQHAGFQEVNLPGRRQLTMRWRAK
jgi:hypothetical protein